MEPGAGTRAPRELQPPSHDSRPPVGCSHPPAPPFDAREALTWSCNSYFAEVARTLAPRRAWANCCVLPDCWALRDSREPEATAEFREPHTIDDGQLAFLGVEGVRTLHLWSWLLPTAGWPLRWLLIPDDAAQVVRAGLQDSASFGMAGQASLGGVPVLGKTGTAEGTGSSP